MSTTTRGTTISPADSFVPRHVGPSELEVAKMLTVIGCSSLDELIDATIPADIRYRRPLAIHGGRTEHEALAAMREIAAKNRIYRSYLGYGYHDTLTPPVIQRNILENPGWYTAYTPYQAEISQGRLEALLNFQTMVMDLTGLEIANASLLDEATAAAEAMTLLRRAGKSRSARFIVDADTLPQTIEVLRTRAVPLGIELVVADLGDGLPDG
jgi:glycine dehydrogenase